MHTRRDYEIGCSVMKTLNFLDSDSIQGMMASMLEKYGEQGIRHYLKDLPVPQVVETALDKTVMMLNQKNDESVNQIISPSLQKRL